MGPAAVPMPPAGRGRGPLRGFAGILPRAEVVDLAGAEATAPGHGEGDGASRQPAGADA